MTISYEVTHYLVRMMGRGDGAPEGQRAQILLVGPAHPYSILAWLDFWEPEVAATKTDRLEGPEPQGMRANLSIRELPVVVDVLRNEKPVRIYWSSSYEHVWLQTGYEPQGEGEGQ